MAVKIKLRPGAKKSGSKSPTSATRKALQGQGEAMAGGRYPIPNLDFLKRAIRSIGRTPAAKRPAVVAWIKKRAAALGQSQLAANLSNAADRALELANEMDAIELAGNIVTPPALTPGARSQGAGKGKIPAIPDKGSGASKKPVRSAPSATGLKSAKAKALLTTLLAKGIDRTTAMKAARKLDQGFNVDEMSNTMTPAKGAKKDPDGDYDGDTPASLGLKNQKAHGVYKKLRKGGKPHPFALKVAKAVDKKLGGSKDMAGSPKA